MCHGKCHAQDTASKTRSGPWSTRYDSSAGQWDWRTEGRVGDIRDRGKDCSSCWAFAAATAFEGSYSVQQGAVGAAVEPYIGKRPDDIGRLSDNCKASSERMLALKWGYVDADEVIARTPAIKEALCRYGPIVTTVQATRAMQAYGEGVFNQDEKGPVNHAVAIIGWDDEKGAWLVYAIPGGRSGG